MKKWFTNNPGLKIISLILAIVTWFYISGELKGTPVKYYIDNYPKAPVMPKS